MISLSKLDQGDMTCLKVESYTLRPVFFSFRAKILISNPDFKISLRNLLAPRIPPYGHAPRITDEKMPLFLNVDSLLNEIANTRLKLAYGKTYFLYIE
jgi:hypothetical protein